MKFKSFFYSFLLFPVTGAVLLFTACPASNLDAPENVAATDGTYSNEVVVTWDAVLGGGYMNPSKLPADYYRVYRSNSEWISLNMFFEISGDVSGTSYTDSTVIKENIYYYKVKAYNDDGTESQYSENDEGYTSFYRPAGEWSKVELPGTICGNGSQYKFFVDYSDTSDNLLIYFEAGGACWDFDTCSGKAGILGAANPNGLPDTYMTVGIAPLMSPLIWKNHPWDTAPTQDWNKVFIPYCTGDIFSGNNVEIYPDPTGQEPDLVWYHAGHPNTMKVIEWVQNHFPHVETMLVSGSSAGGTGTLVNYYFVRNAINAENAAMLNDSGPIYPASNPGYNSYPLHQKIKEAWNLDSVIDGLPDDFQIIRFDFGLISNILSDRFPEDRLAHTQFTMDYNYSRYSYERFYDPISKDLIHDYWAEDQDNLMAQYDDVDNLGYFIPHYRGALSSHCVVALYFDYTDIASEGGINIRDYIIDLLDEDTPFRSYFEPMNPDDYVQPPWVFDLVEKLFEEYL